MRGSAHVGHRTAQNPPPRAKGDGNWGEDTLQCPWQERGHGRTAPTPPCLGPPAPYATDIRTPGRHRSHAGDEKTEAQRGAVMCPRPPRGSLSPGRVTAKCKGGKTSIKGVPSLGRGASTAGSGMRGGRWSSGTPKQSTGCAPKGIGPILHPPGAGLCGPAPLSEQGG